MSDLNSQIADAQRRAAWQPDDRKAAQAELDALNTAKLADVLARADHNGQVLTTPAATTTDLVPAADPASFDGGVRPQNVRDEHRRLDDEIASAEQAGDWTRASDLNALKLTQVAERQNARDRT